jgi:hypothetical protein
MSISGPLAAKCVHCRGLALNTGGASRKRSMAFGKHWEWRGFGRLEAARRRALEGLPLKFRDSQRVSDEYLYVPGAAINVKLREGRLKFKRLLEARDGLERWLEDEAENYPLPLAPAAVVRLAHDLGVRIDPPPAPIAERSALVALIGSAAPGLQVVTVEKERWQREWREGASGTPVTVELAEILAPERVTSVGLEHPEAAGVARALEALGLKPALRHLNYLEALALWAAGRSVLPPPPQS